MAGPSDTLGSAWPPLAIRPCVPEEVDDETRVVAAVDARRVDDVILVTVEEQPGFHGQMDDVHVMIACTPTPSSLEVLQASTGPTSRLVRGGCPEIP
jgi:hypothetical protein